MLSPEVENRIIKFVTKSANAEDLEVLEKWIQQASNQLIFKEFIKTQFAITISMNDPDSDEIRERLLKEIRKEKRARRSPSVNRILKYAAIIILLLGTGYIFQSILFSPQSEHLIIPKEEAITLQLQNGDIQVITEDGSIHILDAEGNVVGTQKGTQLVYEVEAPSEELAYNTLRVPNGKRFNIVLSDDTQVFLNAGSSIKYPIKFIKGKQRIVFLEGEAFFEVTKNEEHPFIVNTQALDVQVLGTRFNMTTYEEDKESEVVLVEGSVAMNSKNSVSTKEETILLPGFKGSYDRLNGTFSTQKVNTSLYTSWITGKVVFRNALFENITKKLERLYNVTIINNNPQLATESFNASIEVDDESIEEVLNYFNKVYEIEYSIVNNKIIIE